MYNYAQVVECRHTCLKSRRLTSVRVRVPLWAHININTMSWNYRVGTKIFSYKKTFGGEGGNQKLAASPDVRLFSIVEVYYSKKNKPNGYAESCSLKDWESMEDLKGTYDLIAGAFTKPILDLDNFPNEYIPEKIENNDNIG